jgi:hypothetical protein
MPQIFWPYCYFPSRKALHLNIAKHIYFMKNVLLCICALFALGQLHAQNTSAEQAQNRRRLAIAEQGSADKAVAAANASGAEWFKYGQVYQDLAELEGGNYFICTRNSLKGYLKARELEYETEQCNAKIEQLGNIILMRALSHAEAQLLDSAYAYAEMANVALPQHEGILHLLGSICYDTNQDIDLTLGYLQEAVNIPATSPDVYFLYAVSICVKAELLFTKHAQGEGEEDAAARAQAMELADYAFSVFDQYMEMIGKDDASALEVMYKISEIVGFEERMEGLKQRLDAVKK